MVGSQVGSHSFEAQREAPLNQSGLLSRAFAEASAQGYSSEQLSSLAATERRGLTKSF